MRVLTRTWPFGFALLLLVGLWHVLTVGRGVSEIVMPSPEAVFTAFVDHRDELVSHTWVTVREAAGGLALGIVVGVSIGIVAVYVRAAHATVYPLALALQAIPIIALGPFLTIWLGPGYTPKIVLAAILVLPIVVVSTVEGLTSVDEDVLDLAWSLNMSRWGELLRIRIPAAVPAFLTALKLGVTAAMVAAISAEYIGSLEGMGYLLQYTKGRLDIPYMWAVVVMSLLVGLTAYGAVAVLERVVFRRAASAARER